MAAQAQRLDRKARRAIAIAIALLLVGPLYLPVKLVSSKLQEPQQLAQPDTDELLTLQDGSTMLVRHGSTGRIMANWLNENGEGRKSFDVGNENFAPGTAFLTHDGWEHVAQFSQLLRAHHEVRAAVLYSAHHGVKATEDLEHLRADRIHDEALKQGVNEEQIRVEHEGYERGHNAAADEGLEVVLTNRA